MSVSVTAVLPHSYSTRAPKAPRGEHRPRLAVAVVCSSTRSSNTVSATSGAKKRIVALHGKGDDGEQMRQGLSPLIEAAGSEWEWVCPTAPHSVRGGKAWWLTEPGERSFEALKWEGVEESIQAIEDLYPFDALLGYSQGAMLSAVLNARGLRGQGPVKVPTVVGSAAWPLPFEDLLESLMKYDDAGFPRTLHTIGAEDDVNPPIMAMQVADCFGCNATVLHHPGGHWIPMEPKFIETISNFLNSSE